jgi:hypothetical protein
VNSLGLVPTRADDGFCADGERRDLQYVADRFPNAGISSRIG